MSSRRLVFAVLALYAALVPLHTTAQERISGIHTGSWFDPNASGHGFNFQLLPNRIGLLYWYTYDTTGRPIFIYSQTAQPIPANASQVTFDALYLDGMRFGEFNPAVRRTHSWGSLTLRFGSCSRAVLTYSGLASPQFPAAPAGSGTINLVKLADSLGDECGVASVAGGWRGFVENGTVADAVTVLALPDGTVAYFNEDSFVGGLGRWSEESGRLRLAMKLCEEGNPLLCSDVSGSAELKPHVSLNGSYTSSAGGSGGFTFEPMVSNRRSIAPADIAGTYRGDEYFSVTIQTNGQFSARDTLSGCSYVGQFTQPTVGRNLFQVTATVSGCSRAGALRGVAVVGDFGLYGDGRMLEAIVDGPAHGPASIRISRQ